MERLRRARRFCPSFRSAPRRQSCRTIKSRSSKPTLRRAIERAEAGQDAEALAYFEDAFEIAPRDPLPFIYLAEFQARRGDMDLAERTLVRGLEVLPRHLSIHRALLSLYAASNLPAKAEAQRKRIAELEQQR